MGTDTSSRVTLDVGDAVIQWTSAFLLASAMTCCCTQYDGLAWHSSPRLLLIIRIWKSTLFTWDKSSRVSCVSFGTENLAIVLWFYPLLQFYE